MEISTEIRFDGTSDLPHLDGADASTPNGAVGHLDEPSDVGVARIDMGNLPCHQLALLRLERVEA